MAQDLINNDLHVNGSLTARTFTPPAGSVSNAAVAAGAGIAATKLEGEFSLRHSQSGTVAAATDYLRIIRGATATVVQVEAAVTETVATGADRTVTIDLQKSTGGAAFATILTAPIVLDDGSTLRGIVTAAIAGAGLVDGDILRLTVAVAGAAGAQALGLCVTVTLREDAS